MLFISTCLLMQFYIWFMFFMFMSIRLVCICCMWIRFYSLFRTELRLFVHAVVFRSNLFFKCRFLLNWAWTLYKFHIIFLRFMYHALCRASRIQLWIKVRQTHSLVLVECLGEGMIICVAVDWRINGEDYSRES